MSSYSKPKKGYDWNPAVRYPPNKPCFCYSGVKFKKCCKPLLASIVEEHNAIKIQQALKDGARLCMTRHARAKLEQEKEDAKGKRFRGTSSEANKEDGEEKANGHEETKGESKEAESNAQA